MRLLQQLEINSSHIQSAINKLKDGIVDGMFTPSTSTYIKCPIDHELWDLKPVICIALDQANQPANPRDFNSRKYQKSLSKLGFTVVRFKKKKTRVLGLRGCELSQLLELHTVYKPPNMTEELN